MSPGKTGFSWHGWERLHTCTAAAVVHMDRLCMPLQGWKKFYLKKSKLTLASRQGYRGRVMVEALGALSMKVDA